MAEANIHGPYEDAIISMCELAKMIIATQPENVRVELWKYFLEDVKAWREFWKIGK